MEGNPKKSFGKAIEQLHVKILPDEKKNKGNKDPINIEFSDKTKDRFKTIFAFFDKELS